jgi:hypothetical protein
MEFKPSYEPWRHGGWYVTNVQYPTGAIGCVSRNYPDKKWRIVCDNREGDHTYPDRDTAAHAEHMIADSLCATAPKCPACRQPMDPTDPVCRRYGCTASRAHGSQLQ